MSKPQKNPGDGEPSFAGMANPKDEGRVVTMTTLDQQLEKAIIGPQGYLDVEQINNAGATQMGLVSEPVTYDRPEPIPMPTPDLGVMAPMSNGWEAPRTKYRKDADPLLVRTLELLERIVAGGLLNPYASSAHDEVITLTDDIRKKVSVKA